MCVSVSVWRWHENQFYNYNNYRLTSKKKWKRRRGIEVGPGENFCYFFCVRWKHNKDDAINILPMCDIFVNQEDGSQRRVVTSFVELNQVIKYSKFWECAFGGVCTELSKARHHYGNFDRYWIFCIKLEHYGNFYSRFKRAIFPETKPLWVRIPKRRTNILAKKRAIQSELAKSLREFVGEKHTQRWR